MPAERVTFDVMGRHRREAVGGVAGVEEVQQLLLLFLA